jgi:hypothetical protein
VQRREDVRHGLDGPAIDRKQQIARADAGGCRGGPRRALLRDDATAARAPEHAILDLAPARAEHDVRGGQAQQDRRDTHR